MVDTRVKRLSMLNFGGEGISHLLLPDVSGSFDAGDRATLLDLYAGFGAVPPGGGAGRDKFTLGTKESLSVTSDPTIGGRWSW